MNYFHSGKDYILSQKTKTDFSNNVSDAYFAGEASTYRHSILFKMKAQMHLRASKSFTSS